MLRSIIIMTIVLFSYCKVGAQDFCFVELNCENLFDTKHDSLKNDMEFVEGGDRHWNVSRYWRKLNTISRTIVSCGGKGEAWRIPDIVALVEVENDSVLHDLTKRSMLRAAGYEFLITNSPDMRGIDVALLYQPSTFHLLDHYSIRIPPIDGMRPTRDILYVKGECSITSAKMDTCHVFVVHTPSRSGGKQATQKNRMHVASVLCNSIDSIRQVDDKALILIAGDFNDYSTDKSVRMITQHRMQNISSKAKGINGAKGTYRFRGEWGSLDQMFASDNICETQVEIDCFINDESFLTEPDVKYGGNAPKRTYKGFKYDPKGVSDHLPLVLKIKQVNP